MSHECCPKDLVMSDPCAAIAHGDLNKDNYANFMGRGEFLLLLAQCGTTNAVVDLTAVANQILACCEASRLILIDIEEDTTAIDIKLQALIDLVTAGNADLSAILTAVQAILVEAEAINANTDQIEALLQSILTIVTAIDNNTDDLEACCAASNLLLTNIEANQEDEDLLGTHTIDSGTEAAAPAAGPYSSWVVVKTNAAGSVTVDGLTLSAAGDSTSEVAQPQHKVPAPVIVLDGGNLGEYEWRTKS